MDVVDSIVRILVSEQPFPKIANISGRRAWSDDQTVEEMRILFSRTMAGKSGEFSLKKLEGRNASNTVYYCYDQNGASAVARNDANEGIEALKQTIEWNSVESKEMLSKESKLRSEVSELK